MLLCNLDCDSTQLHAPSLPSVAHELLVHLYKVYRQWRHSIKNGRHIGGTLMFSSTDAYGENFLISYNLLEKEDMAV